LADSPKARFKPKAPFNDPTDLATIKQIEQEMGEATVDVDIEKLNRIYADDFEIIGSSGKIITKEGILQSIESGKYKLVSYKLGPIDVQVLGNVAIAMALSPKRGSRMEKTLALSLFIWISSRSVQENGCSCAPIAAFRSEEIGRAARDCSREPGRLPPRIPLVISTGWMPVII
jgi:hypothetical protein